jgi:membrane-associated phospholipid phosphatase
MIKHPGLQLLLAFGFFILGLFIKLTYELHDDHDLNTIDERVLNSVADLRHETLTGAAIDITALGSGAVITLFTLLTILTFITLKDRLGAFQIALTSIGAGLWISSLKNILERQRPDVVSHLVSASGHSYPSGHTLAASAFYVALGLILCKHIPSYRGKIRIVFATISIAAIVGLSRIYLGVHYPTDTISGLLFGTSWALLLAACFTYYRLRQAVSTFE